MVLQLLKMNEEITMTKFMADQKYISLYTVQYNTVFLEGAGKLRQGRERSIAHSLEL